MHFWLMPQLDREQAPAISCIYYKKKYFLLEFRNNTGISVYCGMLTNDIVSRYIFSIPVTGLTDQARNLLWPWDTENQIWIKIADAFVIVPRTKNKVLILWLLKEPLLCKNMLTCWFSSLRIWSRPCCCWNFLSPWRLTKSVQTFISYSNCKILGMFLFYGSLFYLYSLWNDTKNVLFFYFKSVYSTNKLCMYISLYINLYMDISIY